MGGTKHYDGVRSRSEKSIEIDFIYRGIRCRETFRVTPTPANLKRVAQHRSVILEAIAHDTFDYAITFPTSKNRFKFAARQQSAGLKLEEYLETWIERKKRQLKASTWASYNKIVTMLNKTSLGRVLLPELRRAHVKEWCTAQNTSNKWLANVQSVLRSALQDAMDDDLIESNPLYGWKYQNAETLKAEDDVDPFTTEEREAILAACRDPQHRNLFEFAFWTGLRTSELIALTWEDIDWLRGEARINKARTQSAEAPETTKTRHGVRDIKLLAPALKALQQQKAITLLQGGVIFRDPRSGDPWAGDEPIRQGPWKTALKKAGVRYRRPYQTRHTYASMMLTAGEPLGWLATQMGHRDLSMLARVYGRWIKSATPDVGNKAVAMFGTTKNCDSNCDAAGSNDDISASQSSHTKLATL
jgi:integrase